MRDNLNQPHNLDAQQIIFLPLWARIALLVLLALLGLCAIGAGLHFLFSTPEASERVVPLMAIAQTAIGAFAIMVFVLFAERQLSTTRLYEKTNLFLDKHLVESLSRIEIPQLQAEQTVTVKPVTRASTVHGRRKDIFGCNYHLALADFQMKFWIGLNVKRLSVIYFVKVSGPQDIEKLKEVFRFTFSGAEKVGYHTHFEHARLGDEHIVSMWSTVFAEHAILGNPAEQLFWTQDIAMMTQSLARTAVRSQIDLNPSVEPGPL